MSTMAIKAKPATKKRANDDEIVKIQHDTATNTTRFFVTMVSYRRGCIRQIYRSTLIKNKVRNVTPPPIPPIVSDRNQKMQPFEGVAFLNPTLTMKLVCENSPTKRSDEANEHSKVFFGE